MEPYIYYGRLPLIEEGPIADYKGYGKETTVTISIRFAYKTWRNDLKSMGFTIDAAFPTIGHYRAQSDVMVSSITPSAPEGPTILVQISGDGSIGLSGEASTKDFDNAFIRSPYESPYRLTIPLKHRKKTIYSDRTDVMPYTEQFSAKDESGRYYTAVGRKRMRYIILEYSNDYVDTDIDKLYSQKIFTYEKDGKVITYYFQRIKDQYGRTVNSLGIDDWVGVIDKVYADGLP